MKFLRKLFYLIAGIIILLCGFIIVCAMKPEITEKLSGILYEEETQTGEGETGEAATQEQTGAQAETGEAVSQEQTGQQTEGQETGGNAEENPGTETGQNQVQADNKDRTETEGNNNWYSDMNTGFHEPSYVASDTSNIVVPDKVKGKNGYQPIRDTVLQVSDTEAQKLQNQLEMGDTGDGLDFDETYYPYYAMLEDDGQHLYRQIYANANNLFKTFAPVEMLSTGELKDVFSAVYNDHPELFWLDTAYSCQYKGNGECVAIDLKFNAASQDLGTSKSKFKENANQIVTEANKLSDSYAKEKYVHDALIKKASYNLGAAMNQSAYSALVNGQTVCAGYARAFQYLMQQLEIPCFYCTGFAGENHAWNIVELEDGYYNVDTTWDDTGDGTYDYFNKTDADYELTHVRQDLSVNLPPCNATTYRNDSYSDAGLRSLADAGFKEENVLKNINDYYKNCHDTIVQKGKGDYSFSNVIDGNLYQEVYDSYFETEAYIDGYMKDAVLTVKGQTWNVYLYVEDLQGDKVLLTHEVSIQ